MSGVAGISTLEQVNLTSTPRPVAHLASLPDERAALAPEAACIDDDRVALTNREFANRVLAVAQHLRSHGVEKGDVVAVMLPNRVEFVVIMFATWRLGATLTPLNPVLTATEAGYQLADSGARVLVTDHAPADMNGPAQIDIADLPTEPKPTDLEAYIDPAALALLIYTSGTTGSPKGVMLTHSNLSAMVGMIVSAFTLMPDDHSLLILPLFHVNGIVASVLSPLAAGGSTTITGRFTPTTFFETVEAVRPTFFSAVPTIYSMLVNLPDGNRPDTTSVRFAACGAAPMPPELIGQFEGRYGITLVEGYGLSECTCAATVNPLGRGKPGTVGLPLPGQEVALRNDRGHIGREGRGEVVLRGPNVMRGYLNKPDDTALTLADGWLRTGDVGYFDDDGYLVLVDRLKDMIIRGGENIYPKEIENVLYSHPDVVEAAVVARSHDVLGEEPVAFVSLRRNAQATPDELIDHCSSSLSRFKVPRGVFVLETLPKNAVGKISKLPLRELLARANGPANCPVQLHRSRPARTVGLNGHQLQGLLARRIV